MADRDHLSHPGSASSKPQSITSRSALGAIRAGAMKAAELSDSSSSMMEEVGTLPGTLPTALAKPDRKHAWIFIPDPPSAPELLRIYLKIKRFVSNDSITELPFPADLSLSERKRIHMCAAHFRGLSHKSRGSKEDGTRQLVLRKPILGEEKSPRPQRHDRKSNTFTREPPAPRIPSAPEDPQELKYHNLVKEFLLNKDTFTYEFPPGLERAQRRLIHEVADRFDNVFHTSRGETEEERTVVLTKGERRACLLPMIAKQFAAEEQFEEPDEFQSKLDRWDRISKDRATDVRILQWNIEWMDYFFKSDTEFYDKENLSADLTDVPELCSRIGAAILEIDPDVMCIEEGPCSLERMELFNKTYLRDRYTCLGGLDGYTQRIFICFKKQNTVLSNPRPCDEANELLAQPWYFDVKGDFTIEEYHFTRTPFVAVADYNYHGKVVPLFVLALHTKSKFVGNGRRMWNGSPEERMKYVRKAVQNRRRIAAECTRTRYCMDKVMFSKYSDPLVVVCGDLNDGPGRDIFESIYLLSDSVDALMGSPFWHRKMLSPLLIHTKFLDSKDQWSCIFHDYVENKTKKVLLDHVMVSHAVRREVVRACIAHEVWQKYSLVGESRQDRVSDHRPVWVDIFPRP
mmetsp:Transcript_20255/g.51376  ORF Transcript_20255/g.51376 Transcript_20255/m.51376 type:complete len:629 (-) Transcript_20255:126-2012(-)